MTKSGIIELQVVEVAVEYEFYDIHYESPLGTRVTKVNVGDNFYVVGVFRDKVTHNGVSGIEVRTYQTDSYGTPITPYNCLYDTTSAAGYFAGAFMSTEVGTVWFRVYDSVQAP